MNETRNQARVEQESVPVTQEERAEIARYSRRPLTAPAA